MDDEGRRLLAGFARSREPSPQRQAAAWLAVSERIGAGDLGPTLDTDPAPATVSATTKLGLVVIGGLAIALAVLGKPRPERSASVATPVFPAIVVDAPEPPVEPVPPVRAPQEAAVPSAPAEPLAADPQPEEPRVRRRRPPRAREDTTAPPPASSLAEEMKLLRRANGQVKGGQPERALETLAEHARRFPNGTLAAEREIKRAEAHCRKGDTKASRRVVDRFLRDHPGTALRSRAQSICAKGAQ